VNKKIILMMAVMGLVSFAGTFIFARFIKSAPQKQSPQADKSTLAGRETNAELSQPEAAAISVPDAVAGKMKNVMTEKQLERLVYEVREKIQEYNSRLKDLDVQEQRLQTTQDTLKNDIEELNSLQIKLASIVASIREERDKLLKSRIEIAQSEKNNLMSIASAYDKMDASSASKILTNMNKAQRGSTNDAVKILHYMNDRTKAKLLAELANSEPALAAYFCQELKQITERE
jgi:flagellar motility protein MotE (MotC chaperone)